MKKILFILLAAFALESCDFLDEQSKTQIPLDAYINNEEEAMLFLYGAYYQVRNTVFGTDFMYLTAPSRWNGSATAITGRRSASTARRSPI